MYVDRSESASQISQKAGLTMDLNRTAPRLCALITAALTLVAVILRTVAMLTSFDADIGYFDPSAAVTVNHALYFVTAALLVAAALFIPRDALPRELDAVPARLPISVLLGLILTAFTVAAFILCVPAARSRLVFAPALLGLPTAVYFLLSANRGGRFTDPLGLAGFLPVLWCVSGIAELYFDPFVTMNSPVKVSLQMGLLGFMFIVLFELRFRIGRSLPRVAVIAWGIGSFACLNASVPLLVATGAGVLDHRLHMLYAAVLLVAGLYGLCLLFGYCFAVPVVAATPVPADNTDNAE
jgi:hypothetical protein